MLRLFTDPSESNRHKGQIVNPQSKAQNVMKFTKKKLENKTRCIKYQYDNNILKKKQKRVSICIKWRRAKF